jgi:hypothetical protein
LAGLIVLAVAAAGADAPAGADAAGNPYAELSNEELAGVADEWERLDQNQRRSFFSEVRRRLLAKERVPIRSRGRFGQVIRRPDATAPRRKTEPAGVGDAPNTYGLGFERRRARGPASARAAPERSRPPGRP